MIVADPLLRGWLEERINVALPDDAQFIGRIEGYIVAAAALSHWSGPDVEISVAAEPGSASRPLLRAIFGYVFDQLGCVRCTARIRSTNHDSIALAERLGFQREGVMRRWFGDDDALIYGLLRDDNGLWRRKATSRT